ncbi:MAG: beta-glucuronidase [Rubricoccaceae bacterium]
MRFCLFLVACLVLTPDMQAQPGAGHVDLIQNVTARHTTSLNGLWHVIVDPYQNGYLDYRYRPRGDGGYAQNRRPQHLSDLVEYAFDESPTLHVPGDWNSQREDLLWYEGTLWYERDIQYTPARGRRVFLHVGAANYDAVAWMNGQELGHHQGGFTPFEFEVTDHMREGTNEIVIKVNNERKREAIPTLNTDWWNYGGLTRDVLLVETPETFIRDYFLQLDPEDPSRVQGWIRLDGPDAARQRVTVSIPEAGVSETVTTGTDGRAGVSFSAPALQRWAPGAPHRYTVAVETDADRVEDRIGFRTLEARGTEILVNGEPLFLRGISMHEEAPYRGGRAFNRSDAETLLGWAQEMGANYVRLAHYPHNETMVQVADSLGLLVWSEIPVYWTIDWENPETYANAEQQLREMITRDKNRAAVAFWSVGNETPPTDVRLAFMQRLVATTRQLDDTRLVTAALERSERENRVYEIHDRLGADLDVLGVNEYIGWYDGLPTKVDSVSWTSIYDKPLIMSEFGGAALHGHRGPSEQLWTEDHQADLYRRTVRMLDQIDFLAGTSPWILMDFRSPRRPLGGIQDYYNRKGLISNWGEKKLAFYVMQAWYQEKSRAAH